MQQQVPPEQYPSWVKFTMKGGASTRDRMLIYFALSVGLSLVALTLWMLNQGPWWLLIGIAGIGLALMYPLAIRWIDRHGKWPT